MIFFIELLSGGYGRDSEVIDRSKVIRGVWYTIPSHVPPRPKLLKHRSMQLCVRLTTADYFSLTSFVGCTFMIFPREVNYMSLTINISTLAKSSVEFQTAWTSQSRTTNYLMDLKCVANYTFSGTLFCSCSSWEWNYIAFISNTFCNVECELYLKQALTPFKAKSLLLTATLILAGSWLFRCVGIT
jgi:hypothetical protein